MPPSNLFPSPLPLVCAVVPAFNRCEKTLNFVRQFASVNYPNKKVIVCDDASTDNTYHNLKLNFPDLDVLRGTGHLWWSGGTNRAARFALEHGADYVLTINDDCHMDPDFLTEMVRVASQDPHYVVGCRIMSQDDPGEIWSIGCRCVFRGYELFGLNFWGRQWDDVKATLPDPYPVTAMPGNGVLIPRQVFEEVGFFDERHMPQYHADSDLVLRAARAGYKPVIALGAVLYNHIPDKPLVNTRRAIIFNKKSDRYWKAVWAILRRYGPFGRRAYLLLMQYLPFFSPPWASRLYRRLRGEPEPKPPAAKPVRV